LTLLESRYKPLGRKSNFIYKKIYGLFFMLGLIAQMYHGPLVVESRHQFWWFVFWDLVCQLSIFILICIFRMIPKAKNTSVRHGIGHIMSMMVCGIFLTISSSFENFDEKRILYFVIQLLLRAFYRTVFGIVFPEIHDENPVNIMYLSERYGLLFLFLLGEGFTIIIQDFGKSHTEYLIGTFLQILLIQTLYYDFQTAHVERHALNKRRTFVAWLYIHNILIVTLLLYAAERKRAYDASKVPGHYFDNSWALHAAIFGVVFPIQCLWFITHFHGFDEIGWRQIKTMSLFIPFYIFLFTIPATRHVFVINGYEVFGTHTRAQWFDNALLSFAIGLMFYTPHYSLNNVGWEEIDHHKSRKHLLENQPPHVRFHSSSVVQLGNKPSTPQIED